ncbi:MAG: hypothetical protein WBD20_13690 [Pirellulaceae bacterium]
MSESDSTPSETPPTTGPTDEELRLAMKAFRKKLKLTRLDEESKLGYGPTSTGEKSRIGAITPPYQFTKAVWKELARQGKLRQETSTLYSLVE